MILTVHVKPGAKQTRVVAWRDERSVTIAIAAPPIDGKANQELIRFLSQQLGVAKSLITIKRGHSGRVKHIGLPEGTMLKNF